MLASEYASRIATESDTAANGIGGSSPPRCDLNVLQCASVVVFF